MEKTLEKGEDKIQQICDALRKETLDPAKQEAEGIIRDAKQQREQIIAEARKEAEALLEKAREDVKKEHQVFNSSLEQSGKQALERLRQSIEQRLFSEELQAQLEKKAGTADVVAKVISAVIAAIEKEGMKTELEAIIPESVDAKQVSQHLLASAKKQLEKGTISLGEFGGGAQIKMIDKKITIDVSDKTLKELLSQYVRKDFRKLLFKD